MPARAAVRSLLGSDAEMISLGFTLPRLYSSNAIDTPDRQFPWAIIRWNENSKAFGLTGPHLMTVWYYQAGTRDYGLIDAAVVRGRELLSQAEHVPGGDGWTLTGASWTSDSDDLTDKGFEALVRFSRFTVACRPVVTP